MKLERGFTGHMPAELSGGRKSAGIARSMADPSTAPRRAFVRPRPGYRGIPRRHNWRLADNLG
jgi:hypothetical protein